MAVSGFHLRFSRFYYDKGTIRLTIVEKEFISCMALKVCPGLLVAA